MSFVLALAAALLSPAAAPSHVPAGTWSNPANSVHVRFRRCGRAVCGTVVWASDKARADAERGGTEALVGATLFSDFVEEEPGLWSGAVFIPDLGRSVDGTITQVDARTLEGEGCLFAGFGCRRQTWTRVR